MATIATAATIIEGASLAIKTFSVVAPVARNLIQQVEALFPKGSGAQKLAAVVSGTSSVLDALLKAGTVSSTIPSDSLTGMVQGLFDSMNTTGAVTPVSVPTAPGTGTLNPQTKALLIALIGAL